MRQSCQVTALQEGVIRANGVKLKSLSVIDLSAHYEAVEELLAHEWSGAEDVDHDASSPNCSRLSNCLQSL